MAIACKIEIQGRFGGVRYYSGYLSLDETYDQCTIYASSEISADQFDELEVPEISKEEYNRATNMPVSYYADMLANGKITNESLADVIAQLI